MNNCIFTGHCINKICDQSCPDLAQANWLLEQSGISINSPVFNTSPQAIAKYSKILNESEGKLITILDKNTNATAELITYCGICKYWKHSRLNTVVYNLKLSQYLDDIQGSWSARANTDELEYKQIWANKAKLLIISNIDYINFKDFQCRTLLSLLQARDKPDFTTVIVSPPINSLVGGEQFFIKLQKILSETAIR